MVASASLTPNLPVNVVAWNQYNAHAVYNGTYVSFTDLGKIR